MAIEQKLPNTGSEISISQPNSGLSTQIIIKVNGQAVGALQRLTVNQNRPLERVKEIGTDGVIEIVPNGPTTFELQASRIVFDQLRLPEAFSRAFRFINAQRLPFDIEVIDISGTKTPGQMVATDTGEVAAGVVTHTYKNCWFQSYTTPYAADTYLITEEATIWCETAFLSSPSDFQTGGLRGFKPQTDASVGIEKAVNAGQNNTRGTMDISGLVNSVFD